MPPTEADRIHTLDDFLGLLEGLEHEGCEVAVIGGLAVGAYGRLIGESLFSWDIDLYADRHTLDAIAGWARQNGAVVRKMPQVRNIPVAFIEWDGKEVNVLTSSLGLPPPASVLRTARVFHPRSRPDISVLVADPFDLLANKLAVNRTKDGPHVEVLLRFIEEEVISAFRDRTTPRERISPARRLLKTTKSRLLPSGLASRLVPLAQTPPEFRFLMNHVPSAAEADDLLARAPSDSRDELREIRSRRRFRQA